MLISEFWNSPEFLFYSCFYDDDELISVMTIYCSLLYWIIAYCLLLSLTLDPSLLFKCCPCFLFSVSTSHKWVFIASNCHGYISYSKHQGILPNIVREMRALSGNFFFGTWLETLPFLVYLPYFDRKNWHKHKFYVFYWWIAEYSQRNNLGRLQWNTKSCISQKCI